MTSSLCLCCYMYKLKQRASDSVTGINILLHPVSQISVMFLKSGVLLYSTMPFFQQLDFSCGYSSRTKVYEAQYASYMCPWTIFKGKCTSRKTNNVTAAPQGQQLNHLASPNRDIPLCCGLALKGHTQFFCYARGIIRAELQ